ncbi:MAG: B12-binding domain-containing radical SAM protein [Bacillota bacterium]
MRCLLINTLDPWQKGTRPLLTSLSLAYLAGFLLEKGHQVKINQREVEFIRNRFNIDRVNEKMKRLAKEFKPHVIGFTATSATIGDLLNSAKILRRVVPGALFVCGGPHVSALPEETLRQAPYLDVAVIGDGEEAMADLCSGVSPGRVKGIAHQTENGPVRTERRVFKKDLDFLPYPARHLLNMDFHTSRTSAVIPNLTLRTTTIVSSRGCPFSCSYCAESRQKIGMRWHSPDYVISEIEHLLSNYRFEGLYFIDSMFEYNRKRAEEICRLMIKLKFNKKFVWSVQARATSMDREFLTLMKEAGCRQIEYGFESGSQKILDAMGKKASVDTGVRIAELTRQCGIRVFANMIFGYPGETEEDLDQSFRFIEEIRPDAIGAYQLEAYPGTALYEQLVNEGKLPLHYGQAGCDWSKVEIQRHIRHLNLSSIPDEIFAKKMEVFRRRFIGPLTTADLLKNMPLRSFLMPANLARAAVKTFRQPSRFLKVSSMMIRKAYSKYQNPKLLP